MRGMTYTNWWTVEWVAVRPLVVISMTGNLASMSVAIKVQKEEGGLEVSELYESPVEGREHNTKSPES